MSREQWRPEEDRGVGGEDADARETRDEEEEGEEGADGRSAVVVAEEDDRGHRLDYVLSRALGLSRSFATRLVREGRVRPEGDLRVKPALKVLEGQRFLVDLPPPERLDLCPEPVDFRVIHEDPDLLVVDKPAGLVVHPAPGHWRGTLVHGLLFRYPDLEPLNGVIRPGIVHRLDATTSGLMVVARNGLALEGLTRQFKARRVEKEYLALAVGEIREKEIQVRLPILRDPIARKRMCVGEGGREAYTEIRLLWACPDYSLLRCRIRTGRTHQIRVHLRALRHPLYGDVLYGQGDRNGPPLDRVFLHSWRLSFEHPRTGVRLAFRCPLPPELIGVLRSVLASRPDRRRTSENPDR
jgi:23S rRNA pseudouridine1911/1915/1917 synthase